MTSSQSNDDLFKEVAVLLAGLAGEGHTGAVDELRSGFGCLNGLTDGWAQFLESIDRVRSTEAKRFTKDERQALERIRSAVRKIVYRR